MATRFQTPQFGQVAMPQSLAPQIADLGTMIDGFTQRRIAIAKMEEQERVNREKDQYYRGRVAAQEKRNEQLAANEQTRMDAAEIRAARQAPGAGPIVLHRGGRARMFNPRFDRGAQSAPAAPPQDIDSALQGFGRMPGTAPPTPPAEPDELTDLMSSASLPQDGEPMGLEEGPQSEAQVMAVPPQQTRGDLYDARNPARDDLEERSRQMYPRQQQDLDTANQALERGESGAMPTAHNKEWADFYGRNASADFETMQREYEAKKAAGRVDAGPRSEVLSVPPTSVQGASYRPAPEGDTVFYDENNDGLVQALIGDDTANLPEDAFPPGAGEGQMFDRNDVGEGGRKGNPFAEPLPPREDIEAKRSELLAKPGTMFVDEVDDGTVQALPGPLEDRRVSMPEDAFPPGVQEGQRYSDADVGADGRKGNPFAEPLPPRGDVEERRGRLMQGGPEVTSVPPTRVQGERYDMRKPPGPRWVYEAEGEEPFVIDEGQRQEARKYEAENRVAQLERRFDTAPPGSMDQMMIARELAAARAGLTGADARQEKGFFQQASERTGRQDFQASDREDRQAFQSSETDKKLANAKEIAAMRRKRGGGGFAAKSSGPGSAFSRLPIKEQRYIERETNSTIALFDREMNWNKLEGVGFDRLELALENITTKGHLAGAAQMEAMMNFFGYIRGGVPAKNETDEFKNVTGTLWTWLERMGMKLGGKGWEPTEQDAAAFGESLGKLPAAQRAGLEQAIRQSVAVLEKTAVKNMEAQIEGFKTTSVPFKERVQDKINAKMRFIGGKPRQWFAETPLIPDYNPGQAGATPSQSPATGGNRIDDLAKKFMQNEGMR